MDPNVHLQPQPLRHRVETVEEFNAVPATIYPQGTARGGDGVVHVAGVPLTDIARDFGTSVFVLNEDDFRDRCRAMAQAFGGAERVHYASKALLTRAIARWVAEEGLSLDVASEGELRLALAADFPAHRITVHGNNKSDAFLRTAVSAGVELIVLDSLQEIERLSAVAQSLGEVQDVLVRVTPGVHVDTHEFIATSHEDQKFGFSLASGVARQAVLNAAAAAGLRLRGLHCHVGSQVFDASGFGLAAERLLQFWSALLVDLPAEATQALDVLDLGGGYGIAYTVDQEPLNIAAVAADLRAKVVQAAENAGVPVPVLNVEPGRAIAGPAMLTLYTVGTIKDVLVSDKLSRRYIAVDGGMSDNIRPALYQAEYDFRIANREVSGEMRPARVVGSHCESGDILINDALIPADVSVGDLLMIGGTGAYCYSMASRYNLMLRPPIVAVSAGQARLLVRGETLDDVLALDVAER